MAATVEILLGKKPIRICRSLIRDIDSLVDCRRKMTVPYDKLTPSSTMDMSTWETLGDWSSPHSLTGINNALICMDHVLYIPSLESV